MPRAENIYSVETPKLADTAHSFSPDSPNPLTPTVFFFYDLLTYAPFIMHLEATGSVLSPVASQPLTRELKGEK